MELLDLEDRIKEFIYLNNQALEVNDECTEIDQILGQNTAFSAVLTLIKQLRKKGQIYRGNKLYPDAVGVAIRDVAAIKNLEDFENVESI